MAEDTAEFKSTYAARIQALLDEEKGLEAAPSKPMFSPEELARRQSANQRQQQLGTLGELSGDKSMGVVGGGLLKQAMEERKRRITEHGEYDPISGELKMFPEYTKRVTGERLTKERGRLTELEARDYSKWLNDRQKAEERQFLATLTGAGGGTYVDAGVDPRTGNPVMRQSKTGALVQQDSPGVFRPHLGPIASRSNFERETKELDKVKGPSATFAEILKEVEGKAGEEAFGEGVAGAGISVLPSQAQGIATAMAFNEAQQETRARVYKEAYKIAHDLAGAAMSYGETIRLQPFIPNPGDPVSVIRSKMRAAMQEQQALIGRLEAKRTAASSSAAPGPNVPKPVVAPGTPMPGSGSGTTIRYDAQGNRIGG